MSTRLRWLAPLVLALLGCGTEAPQHPNCGNGLVDPGEACDDGSANGSVGFCSLQCDGYVQLADTSKLGTWTREPDIPFARNETFGVSIEKTIYLGGGQTNRQLPDGSTEYFTDSFEAIDAETGASRELSPLPMKMYSATMAAIDRKVYVTGFLSDLPNATEHAEAWAYDIDHEVWAVIASLPSPRGACGIAVLNGEIYLMGGQTPTAQASNDFLRYTPSTNQWTVLPPMPTARAFLAGAAIPGLVCALGGQAAGGALATVECFDVQAGVWKAYMPMPSPRSDFGAVGLGGRIVLLGGEDTDVLGSVEVFEPAVNGWAMQPAMPTPRHGLAVVRVGNSLHTIAGSRDPALGQLPTHEVLDLVP